MASGFAKLVLAIFVVLPLAACVDEGVSSSGDAPGTTAQPRVASGPAAFGDDTGGIEGTVTDLEFLPIPLAQVGILPDATIKEAIAVLTDEGGRFSLSNVPPGSRVLVAQALGFDPISKRVEVLPGELLELSIQLQPLPSTDPFHNTVRHKIQLSGVMYKATPQCMYFAKTIPPTGNPSVDQYYNLVKTCGGLQTSWPGSPACACQIHTNTDARFKTFHQNRENWSTIIAEMTWKPQTGASGRSFLMDLNGPNVTRGYAGSIDQADPRTWYRTTNQPPIIHRVDNPDTLIERNIPPSDWNNYPNPNDCTAPGKPNCAWFFRVFPGYCDLGTCQTLPDYGLMQDGTAEMFFTYFVFGQGPKPWTALPDV